MLKNKASEYIYRLFIGISLLVGAFIFLFLLVWLFWGGREHLNADTFPGFLLSTEWKSENEKFGVLSMLISTFITAFISAGVACAVALPAAGFIYFYFTHLASQKIMMASALLSGIPSVLFGLIGMTVIVPWLGKNVPSAQKSGGASLAAAVLVLSLMLIPAMATTFYESLTSLDRRFTLASDALGATKTETFFGCIMPMLNNVRKTTFANAFRRAIGEATAVILVSGNVSKGIGIFLPERTLAGTVVLEMGYAYGTHKSALLAIGFLLLAVTMLIPSGRNND